MSNLSQFMFDRILSVDAFDNTTGEMIYRLPEVSEFSFSVTTQEDEITDATGAPIAVLESAKQAEFSGSACFLNMDFMASQAGTTIETGGSFPRIDQLTIGSDGTVTTTKVASGDSGNELDYIYVRNANGTKGSTLTQSATLQTVDSESGDTSYVDGVFTYDPSTKVIAVNPELAGTNILVYYEYEAEEGQQIVNSSTNFTDPCTIVVRGLVRDTCNSAIKNVMYLSSANAKLKSAFDQTLGKNETQAFDYTIMPAYCGTKKELYTISLPDSDDAEEIDG